MWNDDVKGQYFNLMQAKPEYKQCHYISSILIITYEERSKDPQQNLQLLIIQRFQGKVPQIKNCLRTLSHYQHEPQIRNQVICY